jgi:hypothetical protein
MTALRRNAIREQKCFICSPSYGRAFRCELVGRNKNLKDLADVLPRKVAIAVTCDGHFFPGETFSFGKETSIFRFARFRCISRSASPSLKIARMGFKWKDFLHNNGEIS